MRFTFVLMVMISFLSAAAAQTISGPGEGYGTSQLAFLSGPNIPTFDTNVGKYWNTYITNAQNITPIIGSPVATMNIWMNNFPLGFSTPISIKGTSLIANATGTALNPLESQSIFLRNDVISNFNIEQGWRYSPENAPLSMMSQSNTTPPSKNAKGEILALGITGLFGA